MTIVTTAVAFVFLLQLVPIANAADIPEKEICAATLEKLFHRRSIGRYVKTMAEGNRNVHVFASRKNGLDSEGCYVQGNRVIWRVESALGMPQGGGWRWRDDPQDEVITYSLSGDKVIIALQYSVNTGDSTSTTFSLSKLRGAMK
jgi:hypothetical protein